MPELPEVETVRRVLEPRVAGRAVVSLALNRPEIVAHPDAEAFAREIVGAVIMSMDRRGKYLLFNLSEGRTLLLHLRMTGQLLVTPPDYPAEKHTHVSFGLSDGNELRFIDIRRFGRFWLTPNGEDDDYSGLRELGPEPFDAAFNAEYLRKRLGARRKSIKECLLDQRVVAGIGNIYADEALFAARVLPSRSALSLTGGEWQSLALAIPAVLLAAIEGNYVSYEEYLETKGARYRNEPFFKAYGRAGQPCPRCSTPMLRAVLGGRSSYYCPNCQR